MWCQTGAPWDPALAASWGIQVGPAAVTALRFRQMPRFAYSGKPAEGMEVMQGPTNRPLTLAGVP
jgi:hypothetical protein